jgi:hypothetical protein
VPADNSRELRGLILSALQAQYPYPLTELALDLQILHPFYAQDHRAFARDKAYLAEKKLIEIESSKVGDRVVSVVRITAAGVDVVEGTVRDPGVAGPPR